MKIWETPLPLGYETAALFLRRWLLDLRLRVDAMPLERQKSLEARIRDFNSHGKKGNVPGSRVGNAYTLAKSING